MNLLTKDAVGAGGGGGGVIQQATLPPATADSPPAAEDRLKERKGKSEGGGHTKPTPDLEGDYQDPRLHPDHHNYHQSHHNNHLIYHPTHHNSQSNHDISLSNHENKASNQSLYQSTYHNYHHHHFSHPYNHPHSYSTHATAPHPHKGVKKHNHSSNRSPNSETGVRWVLTLAHLWMCCLWVLLATPINTCADSNGCDFYGSGLEQDGRGVQPVYLSCSSGRVEWQYPRAGLRVILKSPHHSRDFHACIKADKGFQGARIYLEGHRSLLPIYSSEDGRPRELLRCFSSYKGQAALYVEAEPGADDLKKQVASFEYDLQTLPKGTTYDPMEECRPCSEEEMLHLYCSGDFVARGSILSVKDNPKLSHTTITFTASKIFQQTSPVFRHGHSHALGKEGALGDEEDDDLARSNMVQGKGFVGHVEVPLHCGAQAGQGDFVIMGVMRLGHAVLRCAPRHQDWKTLALKSQNRAQCVLET